MAFCLEKNLSVIQVGDNTPGDPKKIATCGLHVTSAVCQAVQPDKCCTNTARHKLTETATPPCLLLVLASYGPPARTRAPRHRSLLVCCFLKGLLNCSSHWVEGWFCFLVPDHLHTALASASLKASGCCEPTCICWSPVPVPCVPVTSPYAACCVVIPCPLTHLVPCVLKTEVLGFSLFFSEVFKKCLEFHSLAEISGRV